MALKMTKAKLLATARLLALGCLCSAPPRTARQHVPADAMPVAKPADVQIADIEAERFEKRAQLASGVRFARVSQDVDQCIQFPPVRIAHC